jgi:hypothetical protein
MKVLQSYGSGIRQASSRGKMVLVLWAFNLAFAAAVYFVGRGYFVNALGQSALGETLKRFDARLFLEMLIHNAAPVGIMIKVMVVLAFLYYWVSVFLTGGILHVLLSGNTSTGDEPGRRRLAPAFFQGVGRYLGRFFRLEVYSLLLWLGFLILQWILWLAAGPLTADGSNEKMIYSVAWAWLAVSLVLVFFIHMILDYARIIIVRADTGRVWRSLWAAVRFVFKRFFGTLGLYYLLAITGGVIFLVYWGIHSRISTSSAVTIWLAFLVGQVFIISRAWLKVAFQAAELNFYGRD